MAITKIIVCKDCLSPNIVDKNCICVWERNYPTIELEFEQCECCGHLSIYPIDNEFNKAQLDKEENDTDS